MLSIPRTLKMISIFHCPSNPSNLLHPDSLRQRFLEGASKLPAFKDVAPGLWVPPLLLLLQAKSSYDVRSSYDNKSSQKLCKMLTKLNNRTSESNSFVLNKNWRVNFGWKCAACCQTDLINCGCSVFWHLVRTASAWFFQHCIYFGCTTHLLCQRNWESA